jgi:hypothetical protein
MNEPTNTAPWPDPSTSIHTGEEQTNNDRARGNVSETCHRTENRFVMRLRCGVMHKVSQMVMHGNEFSLSAFGSFSKKGDKIRTVEGKEIERACCVAS